MTNSPRQSAGSPLWNSKPVTLLLDPEGCLIRLIRGGAHDDDVRLAPGTPIGEIFPDPSGWDDRLTRLRLDPFTTVHVDVPVAAPTAATPGKLARAGTAIPIPGDDGQLDHIVLQLGLAHEVGEQQVTTEQQFRLLAETLPHMLWIARLDGTIEYYSPQWAEFTGKSIDDLLAHGIHGLVHPDDLPALMRPGRSVDGDIPTRPYRLRRHDGVYRWVEALVNPVRDDDGTTWRVVGSTSDIADRLAAEQERRDLNHQLAAALAVSQLGRFTTDRRTDRAAVDQRYLDILGIDATPETLTSRAALIAAWPPIHADDQGRHDDAIARVWELGSELEVEFRVMRPGENGPQERWVSLRARPEMVDDEVVGMVGVLGDVTDQRKEDAARLRSQKREALGTLVGGIAHDFNNVIGAILSNAAVAEEEIAAGDSPATSLAEIRRGAERAGDVVRRLLGFSREGDHEEQRFDLSDVTREACELLRPTLARDVKLRCALSPAPDVLGSSSELHQVVVNLVQNAGHAAADGGGNVDLAIDVVSAGELQATASSDDPINQLPGGRYVRLQVRDDGAGIPPAILTRIFDPFFTTKEAGQGTGLGLAAAQAIVRNHGGEITAVNRQRPDSGAVFTVVLPVASTPAGPTPTPTATAARGGLVARPHVLFVDDEAPLARLAARAFPLHGCTVEVFTDPVEALAAFQATPARFDALVTDLSMPHLSGLELAAEILAVRADIPVVLSSGYVTAENRAAAAACGIREVVAKPCALQDVADAVLRVTARAAVGM
ncbi:MAG: PAS domain-containing protein [Solirubrobacteraceae bacterium]|nr:PAS domain-containing protein [Solirubrobacteraceae bacterium]